MTNPTRLCADCGSDLTGRHGNAKRCLPCAKAVKPPSNPDRVVRPLQTKICGVCEEEFTTRSNRQVTCSLACRNWARRYPGQPRPASQPCAVCGGPVEKRARTTYCSRRCRTAASKRRNGVTSAPFVVYDACQHCGTSLGGARAGKKYCSTQCEVREYTHPGSYAQRANRRCEYCGTALDPRDRINRRHCSDACTVKANQVIRRARRRRLPAERFSRYDIFERDAWVCHLCERPVDPALSDRHPMSASLDHLIPFADPASPGHVRANVALAHLRCNISKCGRVRPADWALYRMLLARYEEDTAWPPRRPAPPQPRQLSVF